MIPLAADGCESVLDLRLRFDLEVNADLGFRLFRKPIGAWEQARVIALHRVQISHRLLDVGRRNENFSQRVRSFHFKNVVFQTVEDTNQVRESTSLTLHPFISMFLGIKDVGAIVLRPDLIGGIENPNCNVLFKRGVRVKRVAKGEKGRDVRTHRPIK